MGRIWIPPLYTIFEINMGMYFFIHIIKMKKSHFKFFILSIVCDGLIKMIHHWEKKVQIV